MTVPGRRAGQSEVLAEVVRQTPFLRRVLQKHGIPASDVEDLAQRCVVAAWESLKKRPFRVPKGKTLTDAVRGWLKTFATMQSLNHKRKLELRAKKFVQNDLAIESAAAEGAGPEEQAENAEVLAALERLGPRRRRLLVMVGAGFDDDEITREFGCNVDVVPGRIQRARAAFRAALVRWRRPS